MNRTQSCPSRAMPIKQKPPVSWFFLSFVRSPNEMTGQKRANYRSYTSYRQYNEPEFFSLIDAAVLSD